jgi:hypothetical protein
MDWFERLTGFQETSYDGTRRNLAVAGRQLRSLVNGRSYGIGELELVSLRELRKRVAPHGISGELRYSEVRGDVRRLHRAPEYAGALFQVASQFNLLEMESPDVTPERGVTIYRYDNTQGPACAIAAGAATIYRNYFVPVGDSFGQTARRQLDGLADVGTKLSSTLGVPVDQLWTMRNGYALCTSKGLAAISAYLRGTTDEERDELRSLLRIGVHRDVEVTDGDGPDRQVVTQAFCSALPVAYSPIPIPSEQWQSFAELVLEAAYEATLWAAVLNTQHGASNIFLLTRLGGGVFGNDAAWIDAAMQRALRMAKDFDLDVRLVRRG